MSDKNQKVRIKLKSYDYRLADKSALGILSIALQTSATVSGPVPIPSKVECYCVITGPHVHKDSRDKFEITTHCRLLDIIKCSSKTVDSLMSLNLPAGVSVEVSYL